ncbi:torso-like protein isoform X1 [Nilaparvata lugens]|uniref:torso-like protein isoform X1 n=1 Tax=Nilaparvata lugens TaxID=108931 RepID=UPI00193CAA02|nr:torso-like protein isoform X1 [Nilaparvata lugens]XP_039295243.1 torso-like protein isoform X2 [Nilaparvata lugens]XP_039295244.1 torso-like protein isoform X1 [Nilaparvata lugens]
MRVVPRNDTDHSWIFREPIVDVFKQVVIRQSLTKSGAVPGSGSGSQPVFQGDFHMEFCDNTRQLLQAYFRDFTIEKMEHPWQAFTSSWSPAIIARNLGIDATHVSSDSGDTRYCFVLVRVARHRESASVASDQSRDQSQSQLQDAVAQQMARVTVGDAASVGEFVRSFGSHYVASYTTGNSLYQVFVYTPIIYKRIKDRLKSRGITSLSTGELNSYFSPWYAEHTGKVLSASGNATMEKWALHNLRVSFYFFNYPSLLKIHGDTALLKQLNNLLQNEALLQLELKTLAPAFSDAEKRKWFEEVVENNMILWDVNM